MKIGIVGLGLMGGSIAMKLRDTHEIHAYDLNAEALQYAVSNRLIHRAHQTPGDFFAAIEVCYLCLYPKSVIEFTKRYQHLAKPNTIFIDISGVKGKLIEAISPWLRADIDFVFTHPIAGREKIGVAHAKSSIFLGANYIITPTPANRLEAIEVATNLAKQLGFETITSTTADNHDDVISYTSQLTHVLSLALVSSENIEDDLANFIGDSYRDLTRIAMINEPLWSELFIENKDHLLAKISHFQTTLEKYKNAIEQDDSNALEALMREAKRKRSAIERG